MREFVYYFKSAVTSGNLIRENLMEAERVDIAINIIISAFFLSHDIRKDVKLHLIFEGRPNPPVHILIEYNEKLPISKKDVVVLIKRILFKVPKEKNILVNVFPGCYIEKNPLKH